MTQGDLPFDGDPPEGSSSRCDGSSHVQCARPGCDRTFDLAGRQAEHRRYCGRDCQRRAWEEAHPRLESGRDALQRLPSKLTRAQKILLRLRQGPATGLELLHAGGGLRYSARIHELRVKGYHIHGPVGIYAPSWRDCLEAIPKTADGHDLYELREDADATDHDGNPTKGPSL